MAQQHQQHEHRQQQQHKHEHQQHQQQQLKTKRGAEDAEFRVDSDRRTVKGHSRAKRQRAEVVTLPKW